MSQVNVYQILQNQQAMLATIAEKSGLMSKDQARGMVKNIPSLPGTWVQKHDVNSLFNEAELPYNEDSFFFDCNLERPVCNLTIHPMPTFLSILPVRPTHALEKAYAFLTDWDTVQTGELPVQPCDDPEAIDILSNFCKLRFPLGRHDKKTQTMELDRLIATACQNAFDDFYFVGGVRGVSLIPRRDFNPRSGGDRDLITRGAVMKQLQAVSREHQKWLTRVLWSGDPANNTAGGGYREPIGLMHLINDDIPNDPVVAPYLESQSGDIQDCDAMNSDCKVFDACIGDPTNDPNIWRIIQELELTIWNRAFQSSMLPARWVWVMRPEIWEVLTKYLPCQVNAEGCTNLGEADAVSAVINIDTMNLNMRQEMRATRTLTINGRRYPIILDWTIPYLQTGTQMQSTIYFIPLTLGGEEVLWIEHMDYRRISSILRPLPNSVGNMLGWTDGGRYHHTINFLRRCFEILSKIEPRIIFKGSRYAGCIEGVSACTLQEREYYQEAEGPIPPPA